MKPDRFLGNEIFSFSIFLLLFTWVSFAQTKKSTNLLTVTNFLYQLDNLDLTSIGNTAFDLVIMDYSSTGDNTGEFTSLQVNNLKNSPGGEKIIISYMSIGEAEDYRFYWNSSWSPGNPSWLSEENPDWKGNFKVKYWDSNWQNIIYQYLDKVLSAGFDGVYLDIIDAYEYYEEQGRNSAAQDMVNFVTSIAAYAKAFDPDFLVIPQNAPELATKIHAYLNAIDGIGEEDIYYGYNSDGLATPTNVTKQLETYLNVFKNANKLVLTIDYPFSNSEDIPQYDSQTISKINSAYSQSISNGYVPYCSVRNLNYLTINPGFSPTTVAGKKIVNSPINFELFQNYPNPFNPSTKIIYTIPIKSNVTLKIYDVLGNKIEILVNKIQSKGNYEIEIDGSELASGIYLYKLHASNFVEIKKMLLLK